MEEIGTVVISVKKEKYWNRVTLVGATPESISRLIQNQLGAGVRELKIICKEGDDIL